MNKLNILKVILVEKKKIEKWLSEQLGKDLLTVSKWCSNKIQPFGEMVDEIAVFFQELPNKSKSKI
ncbi:hypothetical protein [Dysgonomonas gadei]|uniref:HTH cro/C1-type domain-containing protein n=1 Tax=Dysgonomonas gadei ATCC BAA-286 TaxID=742766 RepID=F5IX16_9BACT|nr:hypothetical protein [Dysgonomonas gadei]EGK02363.1 hypothetical protein HMPREF9455_01633 [Dysgonomonas gadei ATCC BAA-286]